MGRDVLRMDLITTYIGAYYLEDLTSIQQKCKFEIIEAQEHFFK
jgi:hypothetical protein